MLDVFFHKHYQSIKKKKKKESLTKPTCAQKPTLLKYGFFDIFVHFQNMNLERKS